MSLSKTDQRLSVDEGRQAILDNLNPVAGHETITLDEAICGRVAAMPVHAISNIPRHDLSAMDGFALAHNDLPLVDQFDVIGESAAGKPFPGSVTKGQAVRIFTGAILPEGTDTVVIQEDCDLCQAQMSIKKEAWPSMGHCVRKTGLDVAKQEVIVAAGTRLGPGHLALCLAASQTSLEVWARPKITIYASGDELQHPGKDLPYGHIYDSTSLPLMTMARHWGCLASNGPIMRDNPADIAAKIKNASGSDLLITIGGASVGDHDHMHDVLLKLGYQPTFWKINMRPGKPLMFATHQTLPPILALPGNPVSALVCAMLFLRSAIDKIGGVGQPYQPIFFDGILAHDLPAGSPREDYMRAIMQPSELGIEIIPFATQDSSMLNIFAKSTCLLVRPAGDPPCLAGERVKFLPIV